MLKIMRKKAKYFYFLFFIVIFTFVFWGIGRMDNRTGSETIAKIGKYKISTEDYWRTYERTYRFYRQIYKDKFDEEMEKKMKLKEKVLDSLIDEHVLLIVAHKMGIQTSDDELHEAITHEPIFMRNGVFDREVYLNRLRLNRLTPELYERSKRQELTLKKIRRLIGLSVDTSDIDTQLIQKSGDKRIVNIIYEQMVNDKKEKVIKSYIEGIKKELEIVINKELIV